MPHETNLDRIPLYAREYKMYCRWIWPFKCQQCHKWQLITSTYSIYQIPTGCWDAATNKEHTLPLKLCLSCVMERHL